MVSERRISCGVYCGLTNPRRVFHPPSIATKLSQANAFCHGQATRVLIFESFICTQASFEEAWLRRDDLSFVVVFHPSHSLRQHLGIWQSIQHRLNHLRDTGQQTVMLSKHQSPLFSAGTYAARIRSNPSGLGLIKGYAHKPGCSK